MDTELRTLAERIETAETRLTEAEAARVAEAVRRVRPDFTGTEAELRSVEGLLHLADSVVPGWSIHLRGKALERDGHWRCTLRETTSRDTDEFIGDGKGPELASAILAALLRVVDYQARR